MEKPDECVICYEKLENENPLQCGHYLHMDCLKKHFKPECVLCRKPLNIQVTGEVPKSYITLANTDLEEYLDSLENQGEEEEEEDEEILEDAEEILEEDEDEEIVFTAFQTGNRPYKRKGFLYPEEDGDFDEENPYGDVVDYEDC